MKNNKNYSMTFYAVINIAAIGLTILMDMVLRAYKQFAFPSMLTHALYISIPIVVSILSYIKIIMQNKTPVWFSRLINILVIVLFTVAIIVFYQPLGLGWFISTYILTTFVFYLQLCSLAYDVFFRKK